MMNKLQTAEDLRTLKAICIQSIRASAHCSPALVQIAYRLEQEPTGRPSRVQDLAGEAIRVVMECVKVLGMREDLDEAMGDSVALFLLCSMRFSRCTCGEVASRTGHCGATDCDPVVGAERRAVADRYCGARVA